MFRSGGCDCPGNGIGGGCDCPGDGIGVVSCKSELGSRRVGVEGVGDTGVWRSGDVSQGCGSEIKI